MKTGMLWQLPSDYTFGKYDLIEQMGKAGKQYETKFGVRPNLIYLHPDLANQAFPVALSGDIEVAVFFGMKLRTAKHVLINCLWLGVEETK